MAAEFGSVADPLTAEAALYFRSLVPRGQVEGGVVWEAEIEVPRAQRAADQLRFLADGKVLVASVEVASDTRLTARLEGVPANAARLEVELPGRRQSQRAIARLGPVEGSHRQRTIYHVMLGYFANGSPANDAEISGWRHPHYAGGDLQGVLEKVDYLADLGIDGVWLSPMFAALTSHGYDATNYYRVGDAVAVPGDPEASMGLYRRLVAALGKRDIGVILDLPLNHADGSYDRDDGVRNEELRPRATSARQEAEKVWESWGSTYRYWDFDHGPTRRFLKDVALYWLTKGGAEGLRMDYVLGVPHDFWSELYAEVRAVAPDAFLVGECWKDAEGFAANAAEIATFYEAHAIADGPVGTPSAGPQFDSLLDFPFQILATEAFARGGSLADLEAWLQGLESIYGADVEPTFFLDNHDLARFMAWTDDPRRLQAAVTFLAAQSSPIVLYYGTETGLAHADPKPGFVDDGRVPMPWDSLNQPLVAATSNALQVRRQYRALTHGGHIPLRVEDDVLVVAKPSSEGTVLVAVNLGDVAAEVIFDPGILLDQEMVPQALVGATAPQRGEDGRWSWRLEALSTAIAGSPLPGGD